MPIRTTLSQKLVYNEEEIEQWVEREEESKRSMEKLTRS